MTLQGSPKHTLPRLLFRALAGRPMDGRLRTNSTWIRRADRDLTPQGRASRWHHLPGWHRTAWRIGITAVIAGFLYGLRASRTVTLSATIALAVAGLAFGIWKLRKVVRLRAHMRNLVTPLYLTMVPLLGHPPRDNPARHLTVPVDYRDDDKASVRLALPPVWKGTVAEQKEIHGIVSRRLGGEWDSSFYQHVSPPYAEFTKSPQPPSRVTFADIRAAMDAGSANKLIFGIGTHNAIIGQDLDSDAPHIALSMGTGAGKSATVRGIIAYLRRHGVERIDVIDPKRVSQNWARGIPGVYIWRNMSAQMDAIHNVRMRMESRYDALDTDETLTFPRHILIIEEQNSWIAYAQQYWEDYRRELDPAERGKVPRKNPAVADLSFILFQGRQGNVNVVSIFQRMSATASGGGDLRENYGGKLLARFSAQTWKLLVGTTPVPRSSRISGRAMFVLGDEHKAVQLAFLTEPEAREYALSGSAVPVPPVPPGDGSPAVSGSPVPGSAGMSLEDELLSLREIADSGVVPIRYGALLKARQRDPEFPAGVKHGSVTLHRASDMQIWAANRLRRAR